MQAVLGVGQQVFVKTTYLSEPHSAVLMEMNAAGAWVDSQDLAMSIRRELANVGSKAAPPEKQFIKNSKFLFIPFTHIQWILAERMP